MHIVMEPLYPDCWIYFNNMALAFPRLLTIYPVKKKTSMQDCLTTAAYH